MSVVAAIAYRRVHTSPVIDVMMNAREGPSASKVEDNFLVSPAKRTQQT